MLTSNADDDLLAYGPDDEADARMQPAQKKARVMTGVEKLPRAGDASDGRGIGAGDGTRTGANAARDLRVDPATRHLDK